MAVPVLFELNHELTRLFAAGSRLSTDDPRLKKFIAPLKKYGEKAPVFLKLAERVEELIKADANRSAKELLETETFLLSVLSTQGDTPSISGDALKDINYAVNVDPLPDTNIGCRTLSPIVAALTSTGSGRMEIVKDAFEKNTFQDPRLYKPAVDALNDKYAEIADYMANIVLPSLGEAICHFLIEGYNIKGGTADGRRLSVIHKIRGSSMLDLVDDAVEKGSAAIRAEAVKIMSNYPEYEKVLLGMLDESKTVREEVMKALVTIDSKTGIDRMIETYRSGKADTVVDAISYGTSPYLAGELLKVASADYGAVKDIAGETPYTDETIAKILKLKSDIRALKNKSTDGTVEFFKTMLSEEYLVKAESGLSQSQKQGYYYTSLEDGALEGLYMSGRGDDFIWQMFKDMQGGSVSKLLKTKKSQRKNLSKMLPCYAFYIGAKRLPPEEFYDEFFKTHLYKDIAQQNYYALQNVFLKDENSPPFSKKIARYLIENMNGYHINLAVKIVEPDDYGTLDLLAEILRNNLKKNTYGYVNYEILKRLGETGHKDFKELYELYRSKNHGSAAEADCLEQFLT